jgi:hypothetical protein
MKDAGHQFQQSAFPGAIHTRDQKDLAVGNIQPEASENPMFPITKG